MAHASSIKFARELAGLTRTALAAKTGLTVAQLRALETGRSKATAPELSLVAFATGVAREFLEQSAYPTGFETEELHFRALKKVSQRARTQVIRHGMTLSALYAACEDAGIVFPEDQLSSFVDEVHDRAGFPSKLLDEDIERLALELREHWGLGLGPIPNLVQLLESRGIAVFELQDTAQEGIDAYNVRIQGGRPAIFIYPRRTASRRRFTVAHELAHLILHGELSDEEPSDLKIEQQANRFAGAFLMPYKTYAATMQGRTTVAHLLETKARWRVSVAAMLVRSHQLGLLSYEERMQGFKELSWRGWRKVEPKEPEPEHPVALRYALKLFRGDKMRALADRCGVSHQHLKHVLSERLPVSASDHDRSSKAFTEKC